MEQLISEEFQKKCEICDIVCSGPVPYKMHMESPKHSKTVLKRYLEQKYEGLYGDRFSCKKCAKTMPDIFSFRTHWESQECERVIQKSQEKELLQLYNMCRVTVTQNENEASDGSFGVGSKLFICTVCSKILRNILDAEQHHEECELTLLLKNNSSEHPRVSDISEKLNEKNTE